VVKQNGVPCAFCHRNRYTCWGHRRGLGELEETLASRLVSAPEGSYTKRLFDDASFLRDKLLEEAQELMEAEEPDHVAAEAADVFYFALTKCAKEGPFNLPTQSPSHPPVVPSPELPPLFSPF
jgi:phosphoribosyl-ATP pyrophosphohydrolase/phosphoribosyl-AMP cyclohydrolase/histidinol dehydrogenase